MPDLGALEVLSAIARTGSLSAAGRELGLTQQAISARLKSIESQAGVRLVTRTTHGSSLTPSGSVVAGWANQVLDVASLLDAGLASLREAARARIKIAASLTIAEQLLPRWLVSMQVTAQRRGVVAPDVTFSATDSEQAIKAVRDGEADLGFIEIPGALRGLRSRVVGGDELIVVVPPEHKWARRSMPLTAGELNQSPLVSRKSGWWHLLGGVGVDQPNGTEATAADVLEFASAASVRAAVLAGAGPAVMSSLTVRDDLSEGRLRAIPVAGVDWRRDFRAVWTGNRTPPAGAVRDLLAHIATGR